VNDLPQFFINIENITNDNVLITGSDSYHLSRVRRVKPGVKIILRADDGRGFIAKVEDITPAGIHAKIINEYKNDNSIPEITLYMALLKGGNFEFVIQKTVELGVSRIVPVVTERTIPDPLKMNAGKLERWEKITNEACKQCLRVSPAFIESPMTFKDVITEDVKDLKIICHPGADIQIKNILGTTINRKFISILIGPEGGFSEKEISEAQKNEWIPVNLGATHLRAETAALVIPSIVIYEWS